MTVPGPRSPDHLGRTLMHEHVMVDFVGADRIAPGRYDPDKVVARALPFLRGARAAGCRTLVECTPNYLGRDPALLRRLAKAIHLNILTNTGLYGAANDKYLPPFAFTESADQLAARWVREARYGIPPAGVRPGIIKIGVDAGPLSEIDAKLVRAAARTRRRTGLAIASHTGDGAAALAELDIVRQEGINPSAFIWVHAQNETDFAVHRRAAELGAWVEFDGIARETVAQYVELVMAMKRHELLHRVLISQDAGWYHVGEPEGGEFRGYDALFTDFLPALVDAGATERDIDLLLVENPARVLAQSEAGGPPGQPPRRSRPRHRSCHRRKRCRAGHHKRAVHSIQPPQPYRPPKPIPRTRQ